MAQQQQQQQHPASASSSSFPKWGFDVFLSFRGDDTRRGFVSYLLAALKNAGINTITDVKLDKGEDRASELSSKIEESRLSIAVFSENYASLRWCLNELEKIIECKEKMGHQVIPVFFKVEPSDIRNLRGKPGEHVKKFLQDPYEKVSHFPARFQTMHNILSVCYNRTTMTELELIQSIINDVSRRLNTKSLIVAHYPVGIEEQIQKINPYLGIDKKDVRMIGICGVEGIGKSTIARAIVNYHGHEFEGSSFLEDVKMAVGTSGIVKFQQDLLYDILKDDSIRLGNSHSGASVIKQRLCSKKVLVVIDGVDDLNHLRLLAGGIEWFGSGSRIILTTQRKDILSMHGVEHLYEMTGLDEFHAAKLLWWNAFHELYPPNVFVGLSAVILKIANGNPGLLIFIGSNLYSKGERDWEALRIVKLLKSGTQCASSPLMGSTNVAPLMGSMNRPLLMGLTNPLKSHDGVHILTWL